MRIFFFLTILLFSLGQVGRISLFNYKINFYLYEIFLFFVFLFLFYRLKTIPIKETFKIFKKFFLFLGFLLFSYLINLFQFSLWQNFIAFLYLLRLFLYIVFFVYFIYWVKNNKLFLKDLHNGIIIFSILTIIISFIQYFLYPDLRNLRYLGWDEHLYRMFGVFFDTSIAATIYSLLFLFYFLNKKENNYIRIIFMPLFLICLCLTFSRSGTFSLFLVLFIYFLNHKKLSEFLLIFIFIIFIFLISPKPFGEGVNLLRTFSINSRINDYKKAVIFWKKFPFLGIGYNRIGFFKASSNEIDHSRFSFSSSYLVLLVTAGLCGLIFFFASLIDFYKILFYGKEIMFLVLVNSFFDNIFFHPFIIFLSCLIVVYFNSLSDIKQ